MFCCGQVECGLFLISKFLSSENKGNFWKIVFDCDVIKSSMPSTTVWWLTVSSFKFACAVVSEEWKRTYLHTCPQCDFTWDVMPPWCHPKPQLNHPVAMINRAQLDVCTSSSLQLFNKNIKTKKRKKLLLIAKETPQYLYTLEFIFSFPHYSCYWTQSTKSSKSFLKSLLWLENRNWSLFCRLQSENSNNNIAALGNSA